MNRDNKVQYRKISEKIIHQNTNQAYPDHDIAIVKVDRPFDFNQFVDKVDLAKQDYHPRGK